MKNNKLTIIGIAFSAIIATVLISGFKYASAVKMEKQIMIIEKVDRNLAIIREGKEPELIRLKRIDNLDGKGHLKNMAENRQTLMKLLKRYYAEGWKVSFVNNHTIESYFHESYFLEREVKVRK